MIYSAIQVYVYGTCSDIWNGISKITRRIFCKKQELREHMDSHPALWSGPCCSLSFFLLFCVVLLCVFTFWVPCEIRDDFCM